MQKPLPLSVCMISGAEALRIGRALESVAGWAGEIIVVLNEQVDDGTDKIAMQHGAKVFREPWRGFIAQKNSCAAKAGQPWLLNLDADEIVSPQLAAEIAATVTTPSDQYAAYEFPRCTFYSGRWIRHGDWYPDRVRRLWRKGSAQWSGRILMPGWKWMARSVGCARTCCTTATKASLISFAKIAPYHLDFVKRRVSDGSPAGLVELALRPCWRFLRAYVFRCGFLDGWQGFYIAALGSFSDPHPICFVARGQRGRPGPPMNDRRCSD
jgi:glycosyltransferase involved in cell wall biosynthesis